MQRILEILNRSSSAGNLFSPESVLLSLLLAFVLGQVIAWLYYFTHTGLSYSKSFVQSLVIEAVVISLIMAVIGNNITRAFGLMGALAIIRFRNVIKDTRDMVFIFCALVVGMATGTQSYSIAIIGTIVLSCVILYLHVSAFGTHESHNGFLRFTFPGHIDSEHPVIVVLKRFCGSYVLVSTSSNPEGQGVEYAYQLMVRNSRKNEEMLNRLEKIEGVGNINLTMQERLLEV
jgi:uncharacterized membrane protein YhiD involved in acid resistance